MVIRPVNGKTAGIKFLKRSKGSIRIEISSAFESPLWAIVCLLPPTTNVRHVRRPQNQSHISSTRDGTSYPDEERRDSEQFFPSDVVSAGTFIIHTSPSKDDWPINIFSTKIASAIR